MLISRRGLTLMALALLFFAMGPAKAGEESLYDTPPPPGAAFLRVIDLRPDPSTPIDISALGAVERDDHGVSPYYALVGEVVAVRVDDASLDVPLSAGQFSTVVVQPGAPGPVLTRVEDRISENPSKAGVQFYNLTDQPAVALHSPKFEVDIVAPTEPGQVGSREVNEVKIDLEARAGSLVIAKFASVLLKRRAQVGFIVAEIDGQVVGFQTRARVVTK